MGEQRFSSETWREIRDLLEAMKALGIDVQAIEEALAVGGVQALDHEETAHAVVRDEILQALSEMKERTTRFSERLAEAKRTDEVSRALLRKARRVRERLQSVAG